MTTPHPLEMELMLTRPPWHVAAFLKRMTRHRTIQGTVTMRQALLTRYYDTPDFALSAQGIALPLRRIGRQPHVY